MAAHINETFKQIFRSDTQVPSIHLIGVAGGQPFYLTHSVLDETHVPSSHLNGTVNLQLLGKTVLEYVSSHFSLVSAQVPAFSHFTGVINGHPFVVGHSDDFLAQAPISH